MTTPEERMKNITERCKKGYMCNKDFDAMLIREMKEYAQEYHDSELEKFINRTRTDSPRAE